MDWAGELLSGGGSALRQARQQRQWSQPQAAAHFVRIAGRLNIAVGSHESVKTALSRWENGKRLPDEANRRVLREMFGLSDTELGLVNDERTAAPGEAYLELSARLRSADGIDDQLVTLLDHHTHELRLLDRRLGAAVLLDKMGAHVEALSGLLTHSVSTPHRAAVGRVLADAGGHSPVGRHWMPGPYNAHGHTLRTPAQPDCKPNSLRYWRTPSGSRPTR